MSMPCEHCINRRQFLTSAAAGAAGLVALSACGDGVVTGPFADELTQPVSIVVANFPGLATTGTLVRVPDNAIVVARTGDSTFIALSMICTHQGCTTGLTPGNQLECPCHFSRFASDGSVINGPSTGEGITPLRQYLTSYNQATDTLTIS